MAIATRQLGNEAQSPIAGQQPPIVGLQAATVNRQSTCRAAKFVRRHVAIVIAAHNHFPAHYDFIDRSKKSAEVRMSEGSEVRRLGQFCQERVAVCDTKWHARQRACFSNVTYLARLGP